jgi:hypothetical protein
MHTAQNSVVSPQSKAKRSRAQTAKLLLGLQTHQSAVAASGFAAFRAGFRVGGRRALKLLGLWFAGRLFLTNRTDLKQLFPVISLAAVAGA